MRGFIVKFQDKTIKILLITLLEPLKIVVGYLGTGQPVVFKLLY
jgi:hypothetical protein